MGVDQVSIDLAPPGRPHPPPTLPIFPARHAAPFAVLVAAFAFLSLLSHASVRRAASTSLVAEPWAGYESPLTPPRTDPAAEAAAASPSDLRAPTPNPWGAAPKPFPAAAASLARLLGSTDPRASTPGDVDEPADAVVSPIPAAATVAPALAAVPTSLATVAPLTVVSSHDVDVPPSRVTLVPAAVEAAAPPPLPPPRPKSVPWDRVPGPTSGPNRIEARLPSSYVTRTPDAADVAAPPTALAYAPSPSPVVSSRSSSVAGFLDTFFGAVRGALSPSKPSSTLGGRVGVAVYNVRAHTVTLPDGTRLEAHSGLGPYFDDPGSARQRNKGATPPHVYDLTLREASFHGVRALRLTPADHGDVYGRTGLLAHPYLLGQRGESNGCVSFKDYASFLRAYDSGSVRRLEVVEG